MGWRGEIHRGLADLKAADVPWRRLLGEGKRREGEVTDICLLCDGKRSCCDFELVTALEGTGASYMRSCCRKRSLLTAPRIQVPNTTLLPEKAPDRVLRRGFSPGQVERNVSRFEEQQYIVASCTSTCILTSLMILHCRDDPKKGKAIQLGKGRFGHKMSVAS